MYWYVFTIKYSQNNYENNQWIIHIYSRLIYFDINMKTSFQHFLKKKLTNSQIRILITLLYVII